MWYIGSLGVSNEEPVLIICWQGCICDGRVDWAAERISASCIIENTSIDYSTLSIEMFFPLKFVCRECFHFTQFCMSVFTETMNKAGLLLLEKILSDVWISFLENRLLIPVITLFNIYSAIMPQIYI